MLDTRFTEQQLLEVIQINLSAWNDTVPLNMVLIHKNTLLRGMEEAIKTLRVKNKDKKNWRRELKLWKLLNKYLPKNKYIMPVFGLVRDTHYFKISILGYSKIIRID